ncbi:MAG: hypothetical protein GTO18_03025 [Anaerolineales bacterium]|nr:hypothetical protein [Anaerolineales bacterium]
MSSNIPKLKKNDHYPGPDRQGSGCFWILVGTFIGILLIVVVAISGSIIRSLKPMELPTPEIQIRERMTSTSSSSEASNIEEVPTETPTLPPDSSSSPTFAIGELVMVSGTGGAGLRIRSAPSLSARVIVLGEDNAVFEVRGGPIKGNGYTWWFLVSPYDDEEQGWSVADYLRPLNP